MQRINFGKVFKYKFKIPLAGIIMKLFAFTSFAVLLSVPPFGKIVSAVNVWLPAVSVMLASVMVTEPPAGKLPVQSYW